MKKLLYLSFAVVALCLAVACQKSLTPDEQVRLAAEEYYQCLIEERYDDYVAGMQEADSMSEEYHQQMIALLTEFGARVKKNRGGMVHAEAVGDTLMGDLAHVYVQITYADSTRETVGIPLVRQGETWRMQ